MPRYLFCYRRIELSPDDLYFPASFVVLFRCVSIPILSIALYLALKDHCDLLKTIGLYLASYLILSAVLLLSELSCVVCSMSGTVCNPGPRRKLMGPIGHIEAILMLLEHLLQIYGIYVAFFQNGAYSNSLACIPFNLNLVKMVIIMASVSSSFFIFLVSFFLYNSRSKKRVSTNFGKYMKLWKRRIEWLCSPVRNSSDSETVIADVASVLADYYKDIDWSLTDLAVGLILLKREQKLYSLLKGRFQSEERLAQSASLDTLSNTDGQCLINDPVEESNENGDLAVVAEIKRSQSKGSNSSFKSQKGGRRFTDTTTSIAKGNKFRSFTSIESNEPLKTKGGLTDWSFSCYSFALSMEKTDLKQPDIIDILHFSHYANMAYIQLDNEITGKLDMLIHFSISNDLFRSPYMISLDHDWSSIVIAIRGTYSAADILVDLQFDPVILDEDLDNAEKYLVHSGFKKTALNIVKEICDNQLLDKIIKNDHQKESQYQIVVCGHSLGAGVASLVAYFLRKRGYNQSRCYGYSMPGSVANEHASSIFSSFCISIVCGDDIVARTTHETMERLKSDIQRLLSNCNLPKYKIFGSAVVNRFRNTESRKTLLQRTQNGNIPDSNHSMLQESEVAYLKKALKEKKSSKLPMYLPGRILYIEKVRDKEKIIEKMAEGGLNKRPKRGTATLQAFTTAIKEKVTDTIHRPVDEKYLYKPRWAKKEEFNEMLISRTMLGDHVAVFGILKYFENAHPESILSVKS
ncbi:hypothetical protein HDV01_002245 [Terramyces sp. JEL0728]|nr:hypothetical protein HDV01_002245 [Terramyces sp. JEL0728]